MSEETKSFYGSVSFAFWPSLFNTGSASVEVPFRKELTIWLTSACEPLIQYSIYRTVHLPGAGDVLPGGVVDGKVGAAARTSRSLSHLDLGR